VAGNLEEGKAVGRERGNEEGKWKKKKKKDQKTKNNRNKSKTNIIATLFPAASTKSRRSRHQRDTYP
jgi:hypothetical protein